MTSLMLMVVVLAVGLLLVGAGAMVLDSLRTSVATRQQVRRRRPIIEGLVDAPAGLAVERAFPAQYSTRAVG